MMNHINDEVIPAARLLLATLFLIFGWRKLRDYSGTVSQMVQEGVPMPTLATAVSRREAHCSENRFGVINLRGGAMSHQQKVIGHEGGLVLN
jgi:uncharacterized membrane protein YphA (DoxX/SURF4 family)